MNYSRLSFLESGKDAIDLKENINKGLLIGNNKIKLPSIKETFFKRSALVNSLLESQNEGSVRKRFSDNLTKFKQSIKRDNLLY